MINFSQIKGAEELEKKLVSHLPLQVTTLKDVRVFAQQHNLSFSNTLEKYAMSDSHIEHIIKQYYEKLIHCLVPLSQRSVFFFLLSSKLFWDIRFHFEDDRLVQIIVTCVEQNPL